MALVAACAVGPEAKAQGGFIVLRIKPKAGSTLQTRFEQTVEMTGTAHLKSGDTTIASKMQITMLSHAFVEQSDVRGTTLLTTTDSVELSGTGTEGGAAEGTRRAMQGRRARLRVATDGSATLVQASPDVSPQFEAVFSGMPSTMPERPVAVHSTWQKTMMIPLSGDAAGAPAATLNATYRLDSLPANSDMAYISLTGTITRDSSAAPISGGLRMTSSGSVTGTMCVDRKHGWWTESHLIIEMKSTLTREGATPMQLRMTVVQHTRTDPAS